MFTFIAAVIFLVLGYLIYGKLVDRVFGCIFAGGAIFHGRIRR